MALIAARRRRRGDAVGTPGRSRVPGRGGLLLLLLAALLAVLVGRAAAAQEQEAVEAAAEPASVEADGARIARWRKHKHLSPCVGCTAGEAMRLGPMFSSCSLFTFGEHMGVVPSRTNLTLSTNETVLVHLVGSRLYFPSAQAFFDLTASLMRNSTCPAPSDEEDVARRVRNITSLCAVAAADAGADNSEGDGALVGGLRLEGDKGGPLCVVYPVEAVPGGGEEDGAQDGAEGDGGNGGRHAAGLYGPGKYHFNFSAFRTDEFRYAFWSVQFLRLEGGGGDDVDTALLRANVTSKGSFTNNPPPLARPLLVNAFFVAALVACAAFFAVFNPVVGNRLVDLGSRSPFLRRHLFEQPHPGPVPRPAAAPPLPGAPRRQMSSRASSSLGMGLGGRSSTQTHYTLMDDREDVEEAGSP